MELKLYFTLFVLGYILNFFFKSKGQLSCGLWGFCGSSAPDPNKLRLLCLYNLKRGEHATGFFADNHVNKATKNAQAFLAENYNQFEALKGIKNFVVIGHDRQSSVGFNKDNVEQAHPHVINDGDKYSIVLAHNGTLSNYYALSDHYKMGTTHGLSDSQILTKIMASVEESKIGEVLQQYDGSATLLFSLSKYKHTLFIHRDPQRELFFYQEAEDRMYVSSMKESLLAIGGTDEDIHEFKGFEIVKVQKGRIVKKWDTSERKVVSYAKTYHNPPANRHSPTNLNFKESGKNTQGSFFKENDTTGGNGFLYNNSYYYNNGHKFTGKMYINHLTNEFCRERLEGFEETYFLRGEMMLDENAFNEAKKLCMKKGEFDPIAWESVRGLEKCQFTKYPSLGTIHITQGTLFFPSEAHRKQFTNEKGNLQFTPALSDKSITLSKPGIMIKQELIAPVGGKARERKVLTNKDTDLKPVVLEMISGNRYSNFAAVVSAVRLKVKSEDTTEFYNSVVNSFLDLVEEKGVAEKEFTANLRHDKGAQVDRKNEKEINTLLDIFYQNADEDPTFHVADVLEALMDANVWFANHYLIDDVDQGTYETLDDLVMAYSETDEEHVVKPILEAVALELARLGIVLKPEEEISNYKNLKGVQVLSSVRRWYDTYMTLNKKSEAQNCCVSDPTPLVAELYTKLFNLKTEPVYNWSPDTEQEYAALVVQLKELIKSSKINETLLKEKHDLTITQITAIYE